jgi:hypothetical protein
MAEERVRAVVLLPRDVSGNLFHNSNLSSSQSCLFPLYINHIITSLHTQTLSMRRYSHKQTDLKPVMYKSVMPTTLILNSAAYAHQRPVSNPSSSTSVLSQVSNRQEPLNSLELSTEHLRRLSCEQDSNQTFCDVLLALRTLSTSFTP